MSHLVCPLCGLSVPLKKFDEDQDLEDIVITEFRGLGRGRGFEVAGTYSILGDKDLLDVLEDRCKAILKLIDSARE